jgi:thiosulfate dehydrogenase [quinone] large subunit
MAANTERSGRTGSTMACAVHGAGPCTCTQVAEPRIARLLFADTRFAWVWLLARLWLGWQWLEAGWHKVTDPEWVSSGLALRGFWERAITVPETGRPPIAYDWYREFLAGLLAGEHYSWFGGLVAWGELLVGVALIVGCLTGLAAFFGVFMNWHFVMAGAASTNAMLALVGVLLVLAWRTAGWWGLDRWLLARLGVRRVPSTG